MDKVNLENIEKWVFRVLLGATAFLYTKRTYILQGAKQSQAVAAQSWDSAYYTAGMLAIFHSMITETPFSFAGTLSLALSEIAFSQMDKERGHWAYRCMAIAGAYGTVRNHLWNFGGIVYSHLK